MRRDPRLHPVLAALPLALWTVFHVWEQWAAFAGREAWIERMRRTSQGGLAVAVEIVVVVVPLLAWSGLALADLARGRRLPATGATDPGSRALARLAPIATPIAIAFLAIHLGHLWLPKLALGASLSETWWALTHDLGRPWMLVMYALGLTAVAVHLAAAIPASLEALGWIESEPARRQATLVASVLALCLWILAVQLVGWLGTGHGTFWSIEVVPASP